MKKKLKYNFLYIIPFHYFKFYNCFFLRHVQGCHLFCNTECSTGEREKILSRVFLLLDLSKMMLLTQSRNHVKIMIATALRDSQELCGAEFAAKTGIKSFS